MTPAELRDAIVALTREIAKKSSSPSVDQWAGEIEALAGQIPALTPETVVFERRIANSERRQGDVSGMPSRRINARRHGPPKPTAPLPTVMTIASVTAGTDRLVGDTESLGAEVVASRNDPMGNYTDKVVSVFPESWTSSNDAIATVDSSGAVEYLTAGSVTFTARFAGLVATVSRTVTSGVATLTSISISPATTSVQTSATRQFTVTEHYDNGTTVVASSGVTFSVVSGGGSVSGTGVGTYTAPGSAGSATVRASKSGFNADAAVTVTGSTGLTYEYFDDFTGYADVAALKTGSEATNSPEWNFTTPVGYTAAHWAETTLRSDTILGRQVLRVPFLAQTNYYINTPETIPGIGTYPHTDVAGDTPRVYVTPAAPMSFIWARMVFRWPQHTRLKENDGQNPPGYTGTMDADLGNGQDQSFGGAALKMMFFQWAVGHPDRQDIVYNNGYKLVAGITQASNSATETQYEGSSILESGGASLITGDYYSLTMMSRIMSASVGRYGFWFQRLSVSGIYNPQPPSYYLLTRTWAVAARQVRQVQFGVNKNHGNGVTRYRDMAELAIIDGNDHENPWNMPGTLVGS